MRQMSLPLLAKKDAESVYGVIENPKLSFKGERLRKGRHRLHSYPAMLHPMLVDCLIEQYTKEDDVIFDPFCGSGVTLLQSALKGRHAIGFDINPLALTIARAKTNRYDKESLWLEYRDIEAKMAAKRDDENDIDVPTIKNIDYWYRDDVIRDLGRIRYILKNGSYWYIDFFLALFALICRGQSLTRNGEFKRYRLKQADIDKKQNTVFAAFLSHARAMIDVFANEAAPTASSQPMQANAEDSFPEGLEYDAVISSPPYGDSRTTVAYGQFSSFGLDWISGIGEVRKAANIDSAGLGKPGELKAELRGFGILSELIESISRIDSKRAKEVLHFFNGYYKALRNTVGHLREGGTICLVVGNRRVKGIQVPLDQITAAFLESMGMKFQVIFARTIHNKVMPSRNSPNNVRGITSETMSKEFIVIFNKARALNAIRDAGC